MADPITQVITPLALWPTRLEAAIAECRMLDGVRVLAETASTQDAARGLADRRGLAVVAWRQTQGRGRLGRTWADTGEEGIAVTFIAPDAPPERLAVASAIAAARTAEAFLLARVPSRSGADAGAIQGSKVGIKWPNDLVIGGRKLAGILIERTGTAALVGIGMNVAQANFDEALQSTATSLFREGAITDRCAVLEKLIREFDATLVEDSESLARAYAARDALRGKRVTFATPQGTVEGDVVRTNPFEGLVVRVGDVERRLPSATTSVLSWNPDVS